MVTSTHQSQLEPGNSAITRSSGCTWTSLANGISATTAGKDHPTPDFVHGKVARSEETSPQTPGWSLTDADLAAKRLGFDLVDQTHSGWDAVRKALAGHHYVLLQGDSDRFGNATCSGAFDGDHCIGVWPRTKIDGGHTYRLIDDPICPTSRWERESVLESYAEKLDANVRFASFARSVPLPPPTRLPVVLRYGARALPRPTVKTIHVGGREANVRSRPTSESRLLNTRKSGGKWTAWQVTTKGENLDGSSTWFGNRTGERWLHASSF